MNNFLTANSDKGKDKLIETKHFLENLILQLEDEEEGTMDSIQKYGLLVPIPQFKGRNSEEMKEFVKDMRRQQIKSIENALHTIYWILDEFNTWGTMYTLYQSEDEDEIECS